ncbi:MAG: class I SAM-dependent methyltransferase [Lachnospiraceae bacterium]|nr:class I SAM-dependent methyltransferase [Lachnospiraceae bacterium]
MKLTHRMQAVASLVTPGRKVADIGCDHGYLPIYLVENHIAPSAVAMDINEGPLKAARKNIQKEGLQDKIKTRRSDGLKELLESEGESVIIAGMGGRLVIKILTQSIDILKKDSGVKELILQPQSEQAFFRSSMRELGYVCVKEDMVFEDGKYYPMGKYVKGQEQVTSETSLFDEYGPLLLKEKNTVLWQYVLKEQENLMKIEESLTEMKEGAQKELRKKELQEKMRRNQAAQNFF